MSTAASIAVTPYQMLCGMAGQRRRSEDLIVETLCPEGIPDAEYRRLLFERPGFASKISVIGARDDGVCYINLYFSRGTAPAWRICCAAARRC